MCELWLPRFELRVKHLFASLLLLLPQIWDDYCGVKKLHIVIRSHCSESVMLTEFPVAFSYRAETEFPPATAEKCVSQKKHTQTCYGLKIWSTGSSDVYVFLPNVCIVVWWMNQMLHNKNVVALLGMLRLLALTPADPQNPEHSATQNTTHM